MVVRGRDALKGREHKPFATFVASEAFKRETKRLGQEWNPLYDLLAIWIGEKIGSLPDYLEKYLGLRHRSFPHSVGLFQILQEQKETIQARYPPNPFMDALSVAMIEAYQSHILLDSTTPAGVPEHRYYKALYDRWKSGRR